MLYKEYGNTGEKVSAVGFGAMRFDMEKSLEQNAELVRYAFDKGITYFDTAPGYCNDKSEEILGLAFRNMPRAEFLVSSKLMPGQVKDAQDAYDKVRRSLDKLQVEQIDFFHVWCIRNMQQIDEAMNNGLYDGLLRARSEGLIRHIPYSSHQKGNEVRTVLAGGKFAGVLLGLNILNYQYRLDGVLAAKENGLGVVAMNPLAGGLIPQNEDKLRFLELDGLTPTETALRFIISNPYVDVALNGFTTREHIDTACRVAEHAELLKESDLETIKKHLSDTAPAICTTCGYCKVCPQNIPIPKYLQFYNDKALFGVDDEKMTERIGFQHDWGLLADETVRAAACIECGKCEKACTQHLPIIARLKEIANWEKISSERKKAKQ